MDKNGQNRGRPLMFEDKAKLEEKIEEYFKQTGWVKKDVYDKKKQEVVQIEVYEPATVTGLAVFLDCSRQTLCNYEFREEFFDTIKKAKDRCEASLDYGALTGQFNPAWSIFSAKNNYDYKDKSEQDLNLRGGAGELADWVKGKNNTADESGATSEGS